MAGELANLREVNSKRVSCLFLHDYGGYNSGESAVFDAASAGTMKKRGLVEINEHSVRSDTNLMGLLSGQNAGDFGVPQQMTETKIAELIDKKLDEKLKPLMDFVNKASEDQKKDHSEPLKNAVKK